MEWLKAEEDQNAGWIAALTSLVREQHSDRKCNEIILKLEETRDLLPALCPPRNGGALLVRHLLRELCFDEKRIFNYRFDHKLVQAHILHHYSPEISPITFGVSRYLENATPNNRFGIVNDLYGEGYFVKSALSEGTGATGTVDQRSGVERFLAESSDGLNVGSLSDEVFIFQKRIHILREFRVHSIEDSVIPSLTYGLYDQKRLDSRLEEDVNSFVQSVLNRLPSGVTRDTLFGWDIARESNGEFLVIEINSTGIHPVFKPGFQCSGFFQGITAVPCLAELLAFVRNRYDVSVDIIAPMECRDAFDSTYWLVSQFDCFRDLLRRRKENARLPKTIQSDVQSASLRLSPPYNTILWMLGDLFLDSTGVGYTPEIKVCEAKTGEEREADFSAQEAFGCASNSELPPIVPAGPDRLLPLSFAQQSVWLLAQMGGDSEAYHMPFSVRLLGELATEPLRRALERIVARHEALRTTFLFINEEPLQRITDSDENRFLLIEHNLSRHTDADAELERLVAWEAGAPFDLGRGPLARGRLIRLAADDHVLLVTTHRIVSDDWSMGVLINELRVLYDAFLRGQADPLPALQMTYSDYTVWQRQWTEGEAMQQQAVYWKTALADVPALLELPTDHPRPTKQNFAGSSAGLVLDEELTDGLKELSQRNGTTLDITLLAAWAALLGRLSGQQDVVIGTPVANRGRVESENLIGLFGNTVPIRLGLSDSLTVAQLIECAKAQSLAALQHQDIPIEKVIELLNPVRSLAHTPLFQVMFTWQKSANTRFELPGLKLKQLQASPSQFTKLDISLFLKEDENRIACDVVYATALFELTTIERYLGYFRSLLEAMVTDETQPVGRLSMLSQSERHRVLYEWNDAQTKYPSDKCVHELFEEQVAKTPDAVAVNFQDASLTYAEVNKRANQLAYYLRDLGVKPDDRVAICVERGFEMIVALLAVLKAGGAYVPLDPAYPLERLRFTIHDSQPVALLTQSNLRKLFLELDDALPVFNIEDTAVWQDQLQTNPDLVGVGLTPSHLVYVIYTSGSTGEPKGVMVQHSNVVRLFFATDAWFQFGNDDIWTLFHSYAFDFSVWEIWGALLYGGSLIVVPKNIVRSPEDFYKLICKEKVTVLNQTPSAFRQLIGAQAASVESHQLRHVIFGGESLEVAMLKPWYEQNRNQRTLLVNMYGITETTVHVTYCALERADTVRHGGSPIGCRIPDLRIYILDVHRDPVPVGVTGEMYIGGAGVARGYLNREELTAEKFLADPFTDEPGARMYRTGDLGRWLADGNIEFLGRNDFQVKIRGFRIELGEIEARLMAHPAVREAVVIAREDTSGDKRLVVYYTSNEEQDIQRSEELRSYLSSVLPVYMVPAAYVRLESLPLTPNGKLDRKALPVPELARNESALRLLTPTQKAICELWQGLLYTSNVDLDSNFMDLGGESLTAIRCTNALRTAFSVEVPIGWLFSEEASIRRLAEVIDELILSRSVSPS